MRHIAFPRQYSTELRQQDPFDVNLLRPSIVSSPSALNAWGRVVAARVDATGNQRSRGTKRIDQTRQGMFTAYPGEDGA